MTTDLAPIESGSQHLVQASPEHAAAALSHILGTGDLSQLTNEDRVAHYLDVCGSLGLNPRTRPFDWIEFYDPQTKAKKLVLYPNRSCAEQLRRQHQISVRVVRREPVGSGTDDAMFVVEVEGTTPTGRTGTAIKYVPLTGTRQGGGTYRLSGQQLANAYMKAETGAMRRLTFSMVGLASPPDMEDLSRARVVVVDGTGQVLDHPTPEQKMLAENPALARVINEPTYETTGGAERAPLAGTAGQAVRPDEIEQPQRPAGPPPSFRASEEDVKRWLGAWFAAVKGLSLDTEDARHAYVTGWTRDELGWPQAKQTDSLRTMFARMTDREAGDFLAHVRALMDDEKRELLAQSYANMPDPAPSARPAGVDQRVHDAVMLTGGPAGDDESDDDETAF